MDRRIRKTKKAVMTALIELMSTKEFEKITINDIARKADVNRSTVYLHYEDKYDLLNQCVQTTFEDLMEYSKDQDGNYHLSKESLLHMLKHVEEHSELYLKLFSSKGALSFREQLKNTIMSQMSNQISARYRKKHIELEIQIQFLVCAASGVLEWWFLNALPCSADAVVEQLWALLEHNHIQER